MMNNNEDIKPKLFLVGMMGSGKSYWTKFLSKKLKVGGYDLDFVIESNEEKKIAEIFAEDGEEYFRKQEAKVLRWFKEKNSFVLGTGGGTPCYHDNMNWMNINGTTIFIDPPIEQLVERLIPEKSHRPLISNLSDEALFQFLTKKRKERLADYEKANMILKDNSINEQAFLKIIKEYA
jgi:shikimate kinase